MKNNARLLWIVFMVLTSCAQQPTKSQEASATKKTATPVVKNIDQKEFDKLAQQPDAMVIDVRTPAEVAQNKIPQADLFIDISSPTFTMDIKELDKNKTYLVYCKSGNRSAMATDIMIKEGFDNVYNLSGGITNYKVVE